MNRALTIRCKNIWVRFLFLIFTDNNLAREQRNAGVEIWLNLQRFVEERFTRPMSTIDLFSMSSCIAIRLMTGP